MSKMLPGYAQVLLGLLHNFTAELCLEVAGAASTKCSVLGTGVASLLCLTLPRAQHPDLDPYKSFPSSTVALPAPPRAWVDWPLPPHRADASGMLMPEWKVLCRASMADFERLNKKLMNIEAEIASAEEAAHTLATPGTLQTPCAGRLWTSAQKKANSTAQFVVANYNLDFGYVTRGPEQVRGLMDCCKRVNL